VRRRRFLALTLAAVWIALAWWQTHKALDALWSNRATLGVEYTADFAVYADPSQSHYWLARLMEGAGLSAF
jgi:hypothetical protein